MCRGTMPSCSKSRRQTLRRSGQLLQHANRLGCIVSCIGRQIAHAFRADGCCRQCAKVDAGCPYRARDFRGGPRFVSPLDSHCVEVIGLGEAGVSGRPGDLSPFDGAEDEEPLPGCSGVRRANTNSKLAPALASGSSFSAAPPARSSIVTVHMSVRLILSFMIYLLSTG